MFHDSMQYAVKILMNTFYGVFASGFYRFTHRDLGSSITAWARFNIKDIISQLEQEGNHVVYSDTDSIFVRSPVPEGSPSTIKEEDIIAAKKGDKEAQKQVDLWNKAKQSMLDFGLEVAERYSKDSAVLEYEKGLSVFFSHGAKKRYVGQVVWPNEEIFRKWYNLPLVEQMKKSPKNLILPHPRIQDRAFVLLPLLDIEPNWIHPILRKTAFQMYEELNEQVKKSIQLVQ